MVVVALRQPCPRSADGNGPPSHTVAPLHAARAAEAASADFAANDKPAQRTYNVAVLPHDKNGLYVYLVPAPTKAGVFPLGGDVPTPETWGGYVVRADTVEFWHGQVSRLHDRLEYVRVVDEEARLDDPAAWRVQRRSP